MPKKKVEVEKPESDSIVGVSHEETRLKLILAKLDNIEGLIVSLSTVVMNMKHEVRSDKRGLI